jgi:signal transduction histidine kinase/ActR/RegA family two-component response regulator
MAAARRRHGEHTPPQAMNTEEKNRKLAVFPRSNPNPVLEFSADGELTYSNDAAQRMAASLGEPSMLAILPPDTKRIILQCLLTGENKLNLQTSLQNRTIAWSFIPIAESKTVHCYANEITERLALEAQLRHSVKMEAVGQLAAGVAHDFNNILTIIQGHADLLLQSQPLSPATEKSLRQIWSAADHAGKLIQQLLMFSRKQVMQPRYVDLNAIISNVSPMLQRMLGDQIRFEFVPAPNLPFVYADVGMIEQVLVNLSINARDAMRNGGRLAVSAAARTLEPVACVVNPEARPGNFVCLSVSDTGTGMDNATLSHLFEPFFTTKETGKGTGLGLATVYGIVKQHQGWITVESKPGAGSTFTIFFPCVSKPVEVAPPKTQSPLASATGTETLLVVEDEPSLRELVVRILELCGYHIYQAKNGVEALQVWEQHKDEIDLLLTDMVMPEGISGRQLAERLQKDDPALKVIYTSGYSPGMAGKDIALLEGFNFLAKPYPPSRLAQVVRECLDGKLDRGQKGK